MSNQCITTDEIVLPCIESPCSAASEACTAANVTTPDDKDKIDQSTKRGCFEEAVKKTLNIPSGYVKVAVLVLRWHPDCDDFAEEHTIEIELLRRLFSVRLGYAYDEVRLETTGKKPQHILNSAIHKHIEDHDGPNHLLIIFYTGHGLLFTSGQKLRLSARRSPKKTGRDNHPATAFWGEAEEPFFYESTEADVLVILDCCFAGYAHKGESNDRRMYELLAACERDKKTPKPGPASFTHAFIQAVTRLLDQEQCSSFTTAKLLVAMDGRPSQPRLCDRLRKDDGRHIHLAPLDDSRAQEKEKRLQERPPEEANLKLRFSLEQPDLTEDQLIKLGEALPDAFEIAGIPLRWIEWVKLEKRHPIQLWHKAAKILGRKNSRRKSTPGKLQQQQQGPEMLLDTRKRTRSETSSDLAAKRRSRASPRLLEDLPDLGLCTPTRSSVRSRSAASDV